MYGGGGGGQWPGQQQQPGGFMQPQATGYMGMQSQSPMMTGMPPQQQQQQAGFMAAQPTGMGMGMGMMPQATGMGGFGGMGMGSPGGPGLGGMRQASYGQQTGLMPGSAMGQQRFLSPQNLQAQPTGMMQSNSPGPQFGGGLQPQATGYPGGPLGMQPTGLMPQMTGLPMDPRMRLMSAQFLPGSVPFSGAPVAGNMNFTSAQMQPSSFQSSIQNLSQQQQGSKEPKIPWTLSKDEKKSYDSIFRAWDQKGSGFLGGDVAIELFGQSGLERDKLMQIWHLSDTENRGKLNLAEFHVAMGLIYRALNGNDIPEHLPPELVPPSAKDLSDSVDFLKDLLKRDANVRQTTALNLPESGSNSGVNYGKTRSFHENPIQKQDATAYKHTDEAASTGYKSSARHLDRKTVRYGGESPADDLTEMKRQLAQTQRMLDSQADRDDEDDREVEKEMEELRFRIKRVQDDIEYYNRRGGRDATDNRRKAERELLHLMHERLPLLEKRLDEKDKKKREKNLNESRDRDRRNETSLRGSRYSDYDDHHSRSQTPTQRDHDRNGSSARDDRDYRSSSDDRAPPPPPAVSEISKPAPAPPAPASVAAISAPAPPPPSSSGPPKNMTPEQKKEWVRAEAQRRVAERMRSLGLSVPSTTSPAPDASVEDRLAAEKAEAEARTAQADAEASAREEARRARLEEQRLEREKAAVSTIKSELKEQEKSDNPPPQMIIQAAREQVDEEEEMLRRREEVLKKEKEERLARFKKLEEEEAEAKRQEENFKQRQSQFSSSSNLPAPVRKGKSGPPPPPPNRSRASPAAVTSPVASSTPLSPPQAISPVAPAPPVVPTETSPTAQVTSTPSGNASTNPFFRMQQQSNGSAAPSGGTNPFYRQQQSSEIVKPSFDNNLPTPQRTVNAASAPSSVIVPPNASSAPARRAPDEEDDWGESDHGDHEDEDPDGPGSTSRATRQNLAAALFSNLVSTPPQSASPAPPAAPPAPPAPALQSTEIAPAAPPPPPPAATSVRAATIPAPTGGSADRGALLGQIRGGLSLKKANTNDRSTAGLAGKVIGDASAPVQSFVPPPTPPVVEDDVEQHSSDLASNPNRQSVDWAGSLAAEQMHAHQKASAIPDEPSVLEEQEESEDEHAGPEDLDGPSLKGGNANGAAVGGGGNDEMDDFDLSRTIRVRTLYPYEAQREEDLGFIENSVLVAHPAKDESSDWWYGSVINGSSTKKGTFPRAYVESIENPKIAKALFDFEGSSPEEMNLIADQELRIVDDQDENWWKVIDKEDRILIVPATYVELVDGASASLTHNQVKSSEEVKGKRSNDLGTVSMGASSSLLASSITDEEEAIHKAKLQSQKDERERVIAISREEKDLRRAIEISKNDIQEPTKVLDDEEESDSDYSTTGWTSSEDDDEDDEEGMMDDDLDGQESEEAQHRRVAERLRVLEAAGILIVQDSTGKDQEGKFEEGKIGEIDVNIDASRRAEDLLLHRRSTSKKKKPERPTRTIGEQRRRKERPGRPSRPPPPPPAPIEKEPEEQMDDAYKRFIKLSEEVREAQKEQKSDELPAIPTTTTSSSSEIDQIPSSSSSPPPSLIKSTSTTASGLLSTLKNISSRRTNPSTVERKPTPTISGPMRIQRNDSPAIGEIISGDQKEDKQIDQFSHSNTISWSGIIGNEILNSIPDQERKRQESIYELIATESTHVRDVQIIVDVFFNAMQPLLQPKAAIVIFGNIEEVLLASVSLLSDLEIRQKQTQMYITSIGDILEEHMTRMSVYIPYCVNQETASRILTSERARDVELNNLLLKLRSEHPSARGLDLSHFLLAPMQRLTRYPLLIGQILRYTNEEDVDQNENQSLKNAMKIAQDLLDTTNESIRQRQSDERLQELTEKINANSKGQNNGLTQIKLDLTQKTRWMGSRKILREEVLLKQKSGRKICLILCNDFILLLSGGRRYIEAGNGNEKADEYLYKIPMPLEELVVRDVPNSIKGRDDLSFQLVHQGREKINIRCSSARSCHSWMHSIDSARADCLAAANKINKRSSNQNYP